MSTTELWKVREAPKSSTPLTRARHPGVLMGKQKPGGGGAGGLMGSGHPAWEAALQTFREGLGGQCLSPLL